MDRELYDYMIGEIVSAENVSRRALKIESLMNRISHEIEIAELRGKSKGFAEISEMIEAQR